MRKFILSIPAKAVTDTYTATITGALTPINAYRINLTDDEKPGCERWRKAEKATHD